MLVVPLVAVVWWFTPNTSTPAPMGQAEEYLRAQANGLLQLQGHDAAHQHCEYWAKHLYLTCSVATSEMPRIAESFIRTGWAEAKDHDPRNGEFAYVRARESARVKCPDTERKQGCVLSLFYPK